MVNRGSQSWSRRWLWKLWWIFTKDSLGNNFTFHNQEPTVPHEYPTDWEQIYILSPDGKKLSKWLLCVFAFSLIDTCIFVTLTALKGHVSYTKLQLTGFHLPAVKSNPPDVMNMPVYDVQLSVNPPCLFIQLTFLITACQERGCSD